jgi:hypothetical protein
MNAVRIGSVLFRVLKSEPYRTKFYYLIFTGLIRIDSNNVLRKAYTQKAMQSLFDEIEIKAAK